jgi:hypothetical protein
MTNFQQPTSSIRPQFAFQDGFDEHDQPNENGLNAKNHANVNDSLAKLKHARPNLPMSVPVFDHALNEGWFETRITASNCFPIQIQNTVHTSLCCNCTGKLINVSNV